MNTTRKIHTIAIFGAVLALALMPIFVNSAYADNTDDLTTKIQKLQEKITSIQERSENLDLAEKKLIAKYKQKVVEYEKIITKADQKQKTQEFFKSELERLEAKEKFQDFHRQVYVAHDKDRGIHTDDTLIIALTDIVEKEDYDLVSAGLDKMIDQYRDAEVRSQLQEYKTLVMDAMSELEEVNNKNTEVLALTSEDIKLPLNNEGFGPENEIFNPEIIKTQLKQQIKTAVTSTKILADKISEEHKSKYQAAKTIASIIDDDKPIKVIDEFSKAKYQTKGVLKALDKLTSANEKAQAAADKAKTAKGKVNDAQNALSEAQAAVDNADPESKEYKNAEKALKKAQKNLTKAQNAADKAKSNADKAAANVITAEQKVDSARDKANEAAKKAADKAAAKAQKAAEAAQKAIDAATKASDKATTAQEKADDLAAKATEAATAAEGADPDSKEAKKAQKAANQAQKAADAAKKAADAADAKQDKANTKQSQANDAQTAANEAAEFAA